MTVLDRLLRRRGPAPISCQELVELLTAYLEDTIEPVERARLDAHLAACAGCQAYLSQLRATVAIAGRVEPEALSDGAIAELGAAFAAWKADGPTG